MRRWSFAATGVVMAIALAGSPVRGAALARDENDALHRLTQAFAAFDARDMSGRRWTARALSGRVVVLDFWATWCPPCVADVPRLRRIQERFGPDRVQVIGISLDTTDRRTLVAWLNRYRADWPQIWDGRGYDGTLAARFDVETLPTSVLVDVDGRVVARQLSAERLEPAIAYLLERHDGRR